MNQQELSKKLGLSPSQLARALSREEPGVMGLKRSLELEKRTGISARVWLFEPGSVLRAELEAVYGPIVSNAGRPREIK